MSSREMGGGELVCRLVAATPPYLYSPAGLPHAFFFSELLRGLVEARAKRPASPPLPSVGKRLRCGTGSAFAAPQAGSGKVPETTNLLSTSKLVPRIADIYKKLRESNKDPAPGSIGLELVVDYVKQEKEPAK